MAKIVEADRKSTVLKHPTLPCLSRYHTINLTAGCLFDCRYCYAQSFRSHPGRGRVRFYTNTLELLKKELPRKRERPALVYFSTACKPFLPDRRILNTLYGAMELLLEHSVFVLISTKSKVPDRFLQLFALHSELIHIQVGLTTADDSVRQVLEPNAPPVEQRLETLQHLVEHDVVTEVRMDPLVPEVSDTRESFAALGEEIRQRGIRRAVASYLFLRRANYHRLAVRIDDWSFHEMAGRLYTHKIEKYCGGAAVRVPATDYRLAKYNLLKRISAAHGISLGLCKCKNPDVTADCCHPQPILTGSDAAQGTLF